MPNAVKPLQVNENMVSCAVTCILLKEPKSWRYDPVIFPPLVVKTAVDRLEFSRGRKVETPPSPTGNYLKLMTAFEETK